MTFNMNMIKSFINYNYKDIPTLFFSWKYLNCKQLVLTDVPTINNVKDEDAIWQVIDFFVAQFKIFFIFKNFIFDDISITPFQNVILKLNLH